MGSFEKTLVANWDILFFVALIEAVIIVLLVSYLLYRIWEEGSNITTNLSASDAKNIREANRWHEECNNLNKENHNLKLEISKLRQEKNAWQINHGVQPSLAHNNGWKSTQSKESERPKNSYNDHAEYAMEEQKKGIYVQETINDDGTVKSEIDFKISEEEPEPAPVLPPRKYEYLEEASDGKFRKLLPSEDKCFFRTWEENGVRKFEFHGNVENALANINAIFDDVCDIEGKQNGATQIINVEPGVLDSNLKVETPAKIKLA